MVDTPTQSSDNLDSTEHIEETDAFSNLISDEDCVLADFYADWCGPCLMMAPIVDELATESDSRVVKVDVEELPELAARYDVISIPAFLIFQDGDVVERLAGMQEKEVLKQMLK